MRYRVTKRIDEIGEVIGGATPSTKNCKYWDGDIPWLSPKDLTGYKFRYISKGQRNITEEGLESCSTQMVPKGTVLFSSRAPIGYIAIADRPLCTNQGFKSVVPNECIDSLFLYYLLKNNKKRIEGLGSGTTFKEVSASTMRTIELLIPSDIKEQKQIASILDSIDSKIEVNNRLNSHLSASLNTQKKMMGFTLFFLPMSLSSAFCYLIRFNALLDCLHGVLGLVVNPPKGEHEGISVN